MSDQRKHGTWKKLVEKWTNGHSLSPLHSLYFSISFIGHILRGHNTTEYGIGGFFMLCILINLIWIIKNRSFRNWKVLEYANQHYDSFGNLIFDSWYLRDRNVKQPVFSILVKVQKISNGIYRVSHPYVDNFGLNFAILKTTYVKK